MVKFSASISIQYNNVFSPFAGRDWKDGLKWVKDCGFDGAELIVSDPAQVDAEEVFAHLSENKLVATTLSTGQAAVIEGLSMSTPVETIREQTKKRVRRDIDFSVAIGKPNVTIGLIRGKGGITDKETEYALLCRELADAADYAESRGVVLNLEPINRYECALINSCESAVELIRAIGNPKNVGILYDAFHSNIEDTDPFATLQQIMPLVSNVHLADSNRRLPGEGHIDFKKLIRMLNDAGYTGFAALEVLNIPSAQHIIENAKSRIGAIKPEV